MFEIGKDSNTEHQKIPALAGNSGFDQIYLIGEAFSKTKPHGQEVMQFKSFDDFVQHFKQQSFVNTTFLVKASRGMALERVLDYL